MAPVFASVRGVCARACVCWGSVSHTRHTQRTPPPTHTHPRTRPRTLEDVVPDEDVGLEGPRGDVLHGVPLQRHQLLPQPLRREALRHACWDGGWTRLSLTIDRLRVQPASPTNHTDKRPLSSGAASLAPAAAPALAMDAALPPPPPAAACCLSMCALGMRISRSAMQARHRECDRFDSMW